MEQEETEAPKEVIVAAPVSAPALTPAQRVEQIFEAFARTGPTGAERSVVCNFVLDGDGGGSFLVKVAPDGVTRESDIDADITATLSVEDFLRIADGTFDGELAVKSERIVIDGDLDTAIAFVGLINEGDVLGISHGSR